MNDLFPWRSSYERRGYLYSYVTMLAMII